MRSNHLKKSASLAFETWLLSMEAGGVMWLRWQRLMLGGPTAGRESQRMVSEKLVAGMGLLPALAAAGAFRSTEAMMSGVLGHYGKAVRANRRRLSR